MLMIPRAEFRRSYRERRSRLAANDEEVRRRLTTKSSYAGLALPVDQDGSARRARGLHMMLVPAEVVRDVPVVHRCGRGHVRAPLHILRINYARRVTTHVRSHHRAADCADAR